MTKKRSEMTEEQKERARTYAKEWYQNNREKFLQWQKRYAETHKEKRQDNQRRWGRENPEKRREYSWKENGMRFNGAPMTWEIFMSLFAIQEGRCAICQKEFDRRRIQVEHDHKTHEVRGLTCWRCNQFLIGSNDVTTAQRVLSYLESPPAMILKK